MQPGVLSCNVVCCGATRCAALRRVVLRCNPVCCDATCWTSRLRLLRLCGAVPRARSCAAWAAAAGHRRNRIHNVRQAHPPARRGEWDPSPSQPTACRRFDSPIQPLYSPRAPLRTVDTLAPVRERRRPLALPCRTHRTGRASWRDRDRRWCNAHTLRCVAACCSMLHCVATCCAGRASCGTGACAGVQVRPCCRCGCRSPARRREHSV